MSAAPLVCAAIGAGALVYATSARKTKAVTSTCASARAAEIETTGDVNAPVAEATEGVSARRSTMMTDLDDGDMWTFSEDAEAQFASYASAPLDATSEKVKEAKRNLSRKSVDSRTSKSIGTTVLSAGRSENTVPEPKISGECAVFNMSPAMAQKIYESEITEE